MKKTWNDILPGDLVWIHSGLQHGILPRSARVVSNNRRREEIILENGESFHPTYYYITERAYYGMHRAFINKDAFLRDLKYVVKAESDPRLKEVWEIIIKEYEEVVE